MPNTTSSKSHHSRKTETPGKPRRSQKATVDAAPADTKGLSLVVAPSCNVPATTAEPSPQPSGVQVMPLAELPAEQQSWYRKPDSPLREQAKKISIMRAGGAEPDAIAKKLRTTTKNVRHVMYIARKNGWLDENDEPVDVEAEMSFDIDRKVVRNMSAALDGRMTNWQTHEMTMALVKRRVKDVNAEAASQAPTIGVVAIRIDMPALGQQDQRIVEANIGGKPAYVDAEVVDDTAVTRNDGTEADQAQPRALPEASGELPAGDRLAAEAAS
jgi:hypothetical protein